MNRVITEHTDSLSEAPSQERLSSIYDLRSGEPPTSQQHEMLGAEQRSLSAGAIPHPVVETPTWLTERVFDRLRDEVFAAEQDFIFLEHPRMRTTMLGGPIAQRLGRVREVIEWVSDRVGPVRPSLAKAQAAWYEPGDVALLHLDNPHHYHFTLLICLEWVAKPGAQSNRFAHVSERGVELLDTPAGSALLIDGSHHIHGRTALGDGESCKLLAVGFMPV